MARDASIISWRRPRKRIWVTDFTGLAAITQPSFEVLSAGAIGTNMEVGLSANTDAATFEGGTGITSIRTLTTTSPVQAPKLLSMGGGAPDILEIASSGIPGLVMAAAGDDIGHFLDLDDIDVSKKIRFRVLWASGSTVTADTITWKVLYLPLIPETTVLAEAATALDTVLVADSVQGTANVLQRTDAGVVNQNKIGKTAIGIQLLIDMSAFAAGLAESKYLCGLEYEYTPFRGRYRTQQEGIDPSGSGGA